LTKYKLDINLKINTLIIWILLFIAVVLLPPSPAACLGDMTGHYQTSFLFYP